MSYKCCALFSDIDANEFTPSNFDDVLYCITRTITLTMNSDDTSDSELYRGRNADLRKMFFIQQFTDMDYLPLWYLQTLLRYTYY